MSKSIKALGPSAAKISVIVCTRNRATALANTLRSIDLAASHIEAQDLEVLVVDNGSSDETSVLVEAWIAKTPCSARYIHVSSPGVSKCKNTALREARGKLYFFTDDDCCLHEDCLVRLVELMSTREGPFIVGGRVELGDCNDLPITIKTSIVPEMVNATRYPGGALMGANLAISAAAYKSIGGFDEELGPGTRHLAAEDSELLLRATAARIPVFYEPSIAVNHFHGRKSKVEAEVLLRGYYFADGAVYAKYILSDIRILKSILPDIKYCIKSLMSNDRSIEGIRFIGAFKLRHKMRGFFSYLMYQIRHVR